MLTNREREIESDETVSRKTKEVLVNCLWLIGAMVFISLFVNLCIRVDTIYFSSYIGEFSVTEISQNILLFITTTVFFILSKKDPNIQHGAILISGFFCAITMRELDHWFDQIYHGFWLYPALLVSVSAVLFAARGRWKVLNEMAHIIEIPYFKPLVASVILLLVFSRIYGMGDFWREVMGPSYLREVKNISEEGIELLSYSLICFCALMVNRNIKKTS